MKLLWFIFLCAIIQSTPLLIHSITSPPIVWVQWWYNQFEQFMKLSKCLRKITFWSSSEISTNIIYVVLCCNCLKVTPACSHIIIVQQCMLKVSIYQLICTGWIALLSCKTMPECTVGKDNVKVLYSWFLLVLVWHQRSGVVIALPFPWVRNQFFL